MGLECHAGTRGLPVQWAQNVVVEPFTKRTICPVHWPSDPAFDLARGRRFGGSYLAAPDTPAPAPTQRVDTLTLYLGPADPHFGHFAIEVAPRILPSLAEYPQANLMLTAPAGANDDDIPAHVWQVLDWFDVPRAKVHILSQAAQFETLGAVPQPEYMGSPGVAADYLDALDAHMAHKGLPKGTGKPTYVSRANMPILKGRMAGEGYLCAQLQALGLQVIAPEQAPLADQLGAYASAPLLIFAEGSAIHGRQLLGRLGQDVLVLNRRATNRTARAGLMARCARVAYLDAVAGDLRTLNPGTGQPNPNTALSILRADDLIATFEGFGLPLGDRWSAADYAAAQAADILAFAGAQQRIFAKLAPADHDRLMDQMQGDLSAAGMTRLWPDVAARLAQARDRAMAPKA